MKIKRVISDFSGNYHVEMANGEWRFSLSLSQIERLIAESAKH